MAGRLYKDKDDTRPDEKGFGTISSLSAVAAARSNISDEINRLLSLLAASTVFYI